MKSDGSTADYYKLPEGATELQHLISYRNLNAQDGEMFRAIYRKGRASHSDELRDAKKVLFYAKAEVERLEKLHKPTIRELYTEATEARMDVVGQNGNTAEHYDQAPDWSKAPEGATHWGPEKGVYHEAWYKKEGHTFAIWVSSAAEWQYAHPGGRTDLIPRPEPE